ncbi:MAG: glycosyltransferase family 4 protein [Saprospiraceae bacterium]
MPSIALVVNAFPRLSESFIANKARFLAANGYRVTVVVHDLRADPNPAPLPAALRVKAAPLAYGRLRRAALTAAAWLRAPGEMIRLWRALSGQSLRERLRLTALYAPFAGERFDVIHFAFSGLGVTYLPILFFLKKKSALYVSCRGHAEQVRPLNDPERRAALAGLFAAVDRAHCVSDNMREICRAYGLAPDKAFVNRPAIDADWFRIDAERESGQARRLRLVSVGRLHWQKGFETLLQTVQILLRDGVEVCLDIVGEGPEREKLVFMTHMLGLSEHVRFRGALAHNAVRQTLAEADVYVQSSLSEGISNALMEAMAMELPSVCSDVGGTRELVVHGQNGLLTPPSDPVALADALQTLGADPALRLRLGRAARQTILRDFRLERQLRVYQEEYARFLASRPAPTTQSSHP